MAVLYLMLACWFSYVVCLILPTANTWGRYGRAVLDKNLGYVLFAIYTIVAAVYLYLSFFTKRR